MNDPRFSPIRIRIATLLIAATMVYLGYRAINGDSSLLRYAFPILLCVCLIGMKFAAPKIPWLQLILAMGPVFIINLIFYFLSGSLPPIALIADKIIMFVCVFGFGASWVRNGYIPAAANR